MQQWQSLTRRSVLAILVLLAWALAGLVSASAQCQDDHIVLNSATTSVRDLGSCIWYLEDPDHSLGFNDVVEEADHSFTRHNGGVLNFGYTESAYWARFDLRVGAGAALSDWILELALPLVDEVVLYGGPDGDMPAQRRAGYEGDWSSRALAAPSSTFRLSLEPRAPARLSLRIPTPNPHR
ncbi:MAG: histidine kinase, partial [Marinobacter sp.]|nr:histidine kinase [Marinobacter sp.]